MIKTKDELRYYWECDRVALGKKRKRPRILGDEIWKYQRCMRALAFYQARRGFASKIITYYYRWKYRGLGLRLGFSIPCDAIGPGLALPHYGTIVIAGKCRVGANCKIHAGVNIGANAGEVAAATIGDCVYIGPGAKIVGAVSIGDGVCIGANAVVVKDVEPNVTVGGVPAKKISDNDSSKHLIKATELVNKGRK